MTSLSGLGQGKLETFICVLYSASIFFIHQGHGQVLGKSWMCYQGRHDCSGCWVMKSSWRDTEWSSNTSRTRWCQSLHSHIGKSAPRICDGFFTDAYLAFFLSPPQHAYSTRPCMIAAESNTCVWKKWLGTQVRVQRPSPTPLSMWELLGFS